MTSIMITGANGAIGASLLDALGRDGADVVGVDRRSTSWNLAAPVKQRDLLTDDPLPSVDVIVHLAAHSQVQPTIDDPSLATENVQMTQRVLDHAHSEGADVIFASSREVFGSAIQPDSATVSLDAVNPYAASKIGCESLAQSYKNCYDIHVTTLRLSNVYGSYDRNPRVIPIFIALGSKGEELTVYGDSKILDFVYVSDVVKAIQQTIDQRASLNGETIAIGSGRGTQLTELADQISSLIDECPGYRIKNNRTGETEKYITATKRAKALLQFDPTPLSEGLSKTINWYVDHPTILNEIYEEVSG